MPLPFLAAIPFAGKLIGGIQMVLIIALGIACFYLWGNVKILEHRVDKIAGELTVQIGQTAKWKAAHGNLKAETDKQNASIEAAKKAAEDVAKAAAADRAAAAARIARLTRERNSLRVLIDGAEADAKTARDAANEIRQFLLRERKDTAG